MSQTSTALMPDAGVGMLGPREKWRRPWEIYPCPDHRKGDCGMCGGSGFRKACNLTACHEHGCQGTSCDASADEYAVQQKISERYEL